MSSIIENAIEVKNDINRRILTNNPRWRCMCFKYKDISYDVCFETNIYGYDYVRQFLVNGSFESPVLSKYPSDGYVCYAASEGLAGIRPFEGGSVVYEFLFKPIGLIGETFYKNPLRSDYFMLKTYLTKNNIPYKEWVY